PGRRWLGGELQLELRVAHDLCVVFQHLCDTLLFGRWQYRARLGHRGERESKRRQHDGSGESQAEGEPEGSGGRVDTGRLTDPLVRDRCEGVVVELRYEKAQPGSRDGQGEDERPAELRARDER